MDEIELYDGEKIEPVKDIKKTLKRFINSLGKQKYRLLIVLLSITFYSILNILAPLYSAKAVDVIWNRIKELRSLNQAFSINWEYGGRQILILLLIYSSAAIFYVLQNFLISSFAEKLNLQLRQQIADKIHKLPLSYFDHHQPGETMSRITNDLDKVSEVLQTGLIRTLISIGTIVGSIIVMFKVNIIMTLVFFGFVLISTLITNFVSKRTLTYASERQHEVGKMNGLVEESYSGRMIIKAFNYEQQSSKKMQEAAEKLAKAAEKADFMMNAVMPATRLVNRFGMVTVAIIGSSMLVKGNLSPGNFQAFFQYMNMAGDPITEISYMISSLQSALASMERVYELLDEKEMKKDLDNPKQVEKVLGSIDFSHVSFGYNKNKLLMTDVSFHVNPGQKIAIVGSTGAGKTTLVNLLMRFYEVNSGNILLDGIPTKEMSRSYLRSQFGMVLQDTWLFEGTIAENIAYGKSNATMDEIRAAAKAAHADFFIRTLPNGYDTLLTNDAENISIGQRQLLTIARVFLCNPAILILDEATSSVDTRTEIEIVKAMNDLMKNRTSFIIAHRLSTIVDADNILLMQDGNIIEQGNHQQLLAQNGAYAQLYNSQFA